MTDIEQPGLEARVLRQCCFLICLAGVALVGGRIATVRSATGEVPFQSANDRSRWATVASLVDYRTYAIDQLQNSRDPKTNRRVWQTIDRVRHFGPDDRIHDYSSKPPLLATLVAAIYATIKSLTGLGIQQHPFLVGRLVLAIFNLPLLALLFACSTSLFLRYAKNANTVVLLTISATFGTLVTPFSITLSNHLPAATSAIAALWLLDTQARGRSSWSMMFLCGVATAFCVTNELPSLAILPFWFLAAARMDIIKTALAMLPGAVIVAAAFFGTNWIAHQSWRPPYAHRNVGPVVRSIDAAREPNQSLLELAIQNKLILAENLDLDPMEIQLTAARSENWIKLATRSALYAVTFEENRLTIRGWDDWYDYPGTYWQTGKLKGVDLGEPSQWLYAFNLLVGHHGIYSLTPIFLLSVLSLPFWASDFWKATLRKTEPDTVGLHSNSPHFPIYAIFTIAVVSIVCLAFYITRPQIDRNYGGVSVGLRWMVWMTPLWLVSAVPASDWLLRSSIGRWIGAALLALSVFSVAVSLENPWTHPWIYNLMDHLGWIARPTAG